MDGAGTKSLAEALKAGSDPALVRSAFDLPPEQRAAIQKALNETFSAEIRIRFETAPNLVSGIELTTNGQKLAWSIADYLVSLEEAVGGILKEQDQRETKAKAPDKMTAKIAKRAHERYEQHGHRNASHNQDGGPAQRPRWGPPVGSDPPTGERNAGAVPPVVVEARFGQPGAASAASARSNAWIWDSPSTHSTIAFSVESAWARCRCYRRSVSQATRRTMDQHHPASSRASATLAMDGTLLVLGVAHPNAGATGGCWPGLGPPQPEGLLPAVGVGPRWVGTVSGGARPPRPATGVVTVAGLGDPPLGAGGPPGRARGAPAPEPVQVRPPGGCRAASRQPATPRGGRRRRRRCGCSRPGGTGAQDGRG